MVCALQTLQYVNTFAVTFNASGHRLDENTQAIIEIFMRIFGPDFSRNLVLVVTHWDFSKRKQKSFNIEAKVKEFREIFNLKFKFILNEWQLVFLDNSLADSGVEDGVDPKEFEQNEAQLNKLRQFTNRAQAFLCQDIKAVLSQKEGL
jgi:hypothetical protein